MTDDIIYSTVDLIPYEYYWNCPVCEEENFEDDYVNIVTCINEKCKRSFFTKVKLGESLFKGE